MKKIYDGERTSDLFLPPGYGVGRYEIRTIRLENILDKIYGSPIALRVKDTPHYKYLMGNKQPLRDYFESCRGITWARKGTPAENMTVDELLEEFHDVINSEKEYLEPPYESHYIIIGRDWHCIDGLRRACVLLANGIEEAPVAWVM
tara:strand:- start:264 stop:704 length:441 start_codon:yes stop_codon:yes gene_type:complete